MVMSLQGTAYAAATVYTYWGEAATQGTCADIAGGVDNSGYAIARLGGQAAGNATAPANVRAARRAARSTPAKARRGNRVAKSRPAGHIAPGRTPQAQVWY